MKFNKKDWLVLGIPVVIMFVLTPILPDRIPMKFDWHGNVISDMDKKFSFLLGVLPFVIYKSYQYKRRRK